MIGLDTNVVVRYLAQDDPVQSRSATRFIEENLSPATPGFVSAIVMAEIAWVLGEAYEYDRAVIVDVLGRLLATRALVIEHPTAVQKALADCRSSNLDFADALIGRLGQQVGCEFTLTFDRKASKAETFRLLGAQ